MSESPAGPYAATLTAENDRLAALLAGTDPSTPVPSCPGWDLWQLLKHVGRGHRWAAQMVASRATEVLPPRDVVNGRPPDGGLDVAAEWLRDSARELLDAVAATGADVPVWTFTGPKPAAWWVRRRLHEATVHRGDAALASGSELELAPDVAADGLSEWLDLVAARPAGDYPPVEPGVTLHLHSTDDELGAAGEWLIRLGDDGRVAWEHGHGKGDVAIRGGAVNLLLGILRRIPAADERLDILGDDGVWKTWLERTGF